MEAGYYGECYVDNFLKQVSFPKNHAILKDIHIPINDNLYLQIDTLIITQKYIAVLEIKNIKGKVFFQRNPYQLVRELDGAITTYKCPEQQLKRHIKKLQILLKQSKVNIPVKGLIVFAYSKTHIAKPPEFAKITMGCDITDHIDEYNEMSDVITSSTFHRLLGKITSKSTEFMPKPLAQTIHLDQTHIRKGLICPNCHLKIMNKKHCPTCKISTKLMQQQAIEEWFYLFKNTITNRECIHYLELKDKFAANHILTNLNLNRLNAHKNRCYTLSQSFWLTKDSSTRL